MCCKTGCSDPFELLDLQLHRNTLLFLFHHWIISYCTTFILRFVSSADILVIHPHSTGKLFLVLSIHLSVGVGSIYCIFLVMIHYCDLTSSPKLIDSLIVGSGIYIPVFMWTYDLCRIWPYWVLSSSLNPVFLALITVYKEATWILFIKPEPSGSSGSSEVGLFGIYDPTEIYFSFGSFSVVSAATTIMLGWVVRGRMESNCVLTSLFLTSHSTVRPREYLKETCHCTFIKGFYLVEFIAASLYDNERLKIRVYQLGNGWMHYGLSIQEVLGS